MSLQEDARRFQEGRQGGAQQHGTSRAAASSEPRQEGTVKWYNPAKGFGFIVPDGGGKDIFIHANQVAKSRIETLFGGDRVSYEVLTRGDKSSAQNIRRLH